MGSATIRSNALVGIPIATLSDISWLLGFTEQLMGTDRRGYAVWEEVKEAVLEAIERGEVVPVDQAANGRRPNDG